MLLEKIALTLAFAFLFEVPTEDDDGKQGIRNEDCNSDYHFSFISFPMAIDRTVDGSRNANWVGRTGRCHLFSIRPPRSQWRLFTVLYDVGACRCGPIGFAIRIELGIVKKPASFDRGRLFIFIVMLLLFFGRRWFFFRFRLSSFA